MSIDPLPIFFSRWISKDIGWVFPPLELIGLVLKFLLDQLKLHQDCGCFELVLERPLAIWYKFLTKFRPVHRFEAGTDMFRERRETVSVRCAKVKEPWRVIASNM